MGPVTEQHDEEARARRPRRGWSRWLRRLLAGLLVLLLLLVGGALTLLALLDQPTVKGWIIGDLRERTGVVLDYEKLDVSVFSGLRLENLRVATPEPFAAFAPDLLVLDTLEADWGLPGMSSDLRIDRARLRGLRLVVVVDEQGKTSLDLLGAAAEQGEPKAEPGEGPAEPAPESPLSRTLADLGLPDMSVGDLLLEGARIELVEVAGGAVRRRSTLGPLGFGGSLTSANGALDMALAFLPEGDVQVTAEPAGQKARHASVALTQKLEVSGTEQVETELDVRLRRQDLLEDWGFVGLLARLEASVSFRAREGETVIELSELNLLDGAIRANGALALPDGTGAFLLRTAEGRVDLDRVDALVPTELSAMLGLGGRHVEGAELRWTAHDLAFALGPDAPADGTLELRGQASAAELELGAQRAELDGLTFALDLAAAGGGALAATGSVDVESARLVEPTGSPRMAATGVRLGFDSSGLAWTDGRPEGEVAAYAGVERADVAAGGLRAAVQALELDARGRCPGSGTSGCDVAVSAPMRALALALAGEEGAPGLDVAAGDSELELTAAGLDPADPAGSLDGVRVGGSLGALRFDDGRWKIAADRLGLTARSSLRILPPAGGELELPFDGLRITDRARARELVAWQQGRIGLRVDRLRLDEQSPARSAADVHLEVEGDGGLRLVTRVDKGLDDAALHLDVAMDSLGPLVPILPLPLLRLLGLPGAATSFSLVVDGQVRDLFGTPYATQQTRLRAAQVQLHRPGLNVRLPLIDLQASGQGTMRKHRAETRVDVLSPQVAGYRAPGPLSVLSVVELDVDRRKVDATLSATGPAGPRVSSTLALSQGRGALSWKLDLDARALGPWGRIVRKLAGDGGDGDPELRVASEGRVTGLVRDLDPDGIPIFSRDPVRTLRGRSRTTVDAKGLRYRGESVDARASSLALALDAARDGEGTSVDMHLKSPDLAVELGDQRFELSTLDQRIGLAGPADLAGGTATLTVATTLAALRQTAFAGYPVEGLEIVAGARLDHLDRLRLDRLLVDNPGGGTRFEASFGIEGLDLAGAAADARASEGGVPGAAVPGVRNLEARGTLSQGLDRVVLPGEGMRASGSLEIPFLVQSANRQTFRIAASIHAEDVSAGVDEADLRVAGLTGVIPIEEEVELLPDGGARLLPGPGANLYSQTRFQDVHPFLSSRDFLAIRSIRAGELELGPLAGNVRVERDVLAIDQMECSVLGGTVTGQLLAALDPDSPRLRFRGNATGLRAGGSDEVLDANATLVLAPFDYEASGRVEILRVGPDNLRALLDAIDPYREDVDMNRARLALAVGYPKTVQIRLDEGFLSLRIELGGVAGLVAVHEIRGVPTGPFLRRFLPERP